ncbi:MAG: TetR/AcrR family transcriptional regulator [Rhodoferax sp.]
MCPICPIQNIADSVRAKRERRKEARPGELLAAALELFVEKGYAATRAEEVAQRAGVSKGTLFLYFSSKEELFKAVVRENIAVRFGEWKAEVDGFEGSSAALLRYAMQMWWERIGSTRLAGISKLMMSEAGNFPELAAFYHQEVVLPGQALVRHILARGMHSGEFGPMDLDYGVYSLIAPMMFLTTWNHSLGCCTAATNLIDPQRYIHCQVETLLHGLLRRNGDAAAPGNAPV